MSKRNVSKDARDCRHCNTWLAPEKKALQPFGIRYFNCKLWVPAP